MGRLRGLGPTQGPHPHPPPGSSTGPAGSQCFPHTGWSEPSITAGLWAFCIPKAASQGTPRPGVQPWNTDVCALGGAGTGWTESHSQRLVGQGQDTQATEVRSKSPPCPASGLSRPRGRELWPWQGQGQAWASNPLWCLAAKTLRRSRPCPGCDGVAGCVGLWGGAVAETASDGDHSFRKES